MRTRPMVAVLVTCTVVISVSTGAASSSGAAPDGAVSATVGSAAPLAVLSDGAGEALDRIRDRIVRLEGRTAAYERTGRWFGRWLRCTSHLPVDRVGSLEHDWGYEYDERDGTGVDLRPALARHRGSSRPDLLLLRRSREPGCLSTAPDPNGTGDDSRRAGVSTPAGEPASTPTPAARKPWAELRRLERRFASLDKRIDGVDATFERFDEWESCLSWLPVTEFGRAYQDLGYHYDSEAADPGTAAPDRYLSALDVDDSEWDDPDYELLAFLGRDRPFADRECGHEPGEGIDRLGGHPRSPDRFGRPVRGGAFQDRLDDLRRDVDGAAEDVEDQLEPVQEFVHFDECMFTIGVQDRGSDRHGYRFRARDGTRSYRSALSFDLRGLGLPEIDVMAFSGEEPPQIECNEDAGGQDTDE